MNLKEAKKLKPGAIVRESWFPTTGPEWHGIVLSKVHVKKRHMAHMLGVMKDEPDSRKIFGNYLHPDTVVIAAVNGGEHGSQYQVGEMDPAELDRWTVFDVEPTTEDWLDWAKSNVATEVWDFINQNRSHLEHGEDFEPNKVYPSRRSWKRLNDCLESADMLGRGPQPGHLPPCYWLRRFRGCGVLQRLREELRASGHGRDDS